jgi:hypothetical protein
LASVIVFAGSLAACSSSTVSGGPAAAPAGATATTGQSGPSGTFVYWDQNEEVEYVHPPSTHVGVLVPPWDPNGQLCVLPDGSGRFVTGYNPTNPDGQADNPGSKMKFKDPPVGEALWNGDGSFTGTTFFVPGDYKNGPLGGANDPTLGGDIPPDPSGNNHFNNNGTFTGCAFGRNKNLYASDLGTAQGDIPPPDTGRVIMWFAPDYKDACILVGPTAGGTGPHHVDGSGGLRNPGTMTSDADGNVYVPEAGSVDAIGQAGHGHVLKIDATTVPSSPAGCPGQLPDKPPDVSVFISSDQQPFPLGIAQDPTCDCFAVSNVFGGAAVAWYDRSGHPTLRPPVPSDPGYNPFGLAFTPDGTLYFIDIHVAAQPNGGFGPVDGGGGLMQVTFGPGSTPSVSRVAGGMSFPTSVTACDGSHQTCPAPTEDHGPPFTVADRGTSPASKAG